MRFVKDETGCYYDSLHPQDKYGKLCPVDATTPATWAYTLLQKGQDAIDHGFGLCADGSEYDLINFMCDTHGGSVPWNPIQYELMYREMQKLPNFVQVLDDFYKKYEYAYFYKTWEENNYACEGNDIEYTLS